MNLRVWGPSRLIDVLLIAALAIAGPIPAFATETHQFDVPAEDAPTAIRDFATQAHVQILVAGENVREKRLHPVSGEFSTEQGLRILLADSGLSPTYVGDRSIALVVASDSSHPLLQGTAQEGKKSASNGFRVAQVDQGTNSQSSKVGTDTSISEDTAKKAELTEIIVTAQKREERLIDTPESVSVLSGDYLAKIGAVQFSDFANAVPGLSFKTAGAGYTSISLRGVTAGFDFSPTVGIYVDDVPYGSSTGFNQSAQTALDVGLFDIDRIEVLRGPQGTLYGASTMGGLIKYVSKIPDTTTSTVDVQTGAAGIHEGGVSYNGSIAVNEPIVADKAAVRVSAFYSHDGGYIDNLARDESDVNRSGIYGGRLDLLLTPVDTLSVRLVGFLQDISRDGEATADYAFAGTPKYGSLDQYRQFAEPYHQQFRLISATVGYDFGPAALTSISSYQSVRTNFVDDISANYVQYCPYAGRSCSAVGYNVGLSTDKFTEEMRLASKGATALEWQLGGFYTHEASGNVQNFPSLDLAGQPGPNDLFTFSSPTTYEERAVFGDLTWHITNKVDVGGGLRYARNDQTYVQYGGGIFGASVPLRTSGQGVVTYLGDARYHFTDNATGYLRYATGYRPGGPNFAAIDATTKQPIGGAAFQPDSLKSYEAGFKTETPDRHFGVDVSVYDIDWSNIQISTVRGGFSAVANAPGGAGVQGAELTLTARPTSALTATGAFAYQHAYLKQADADLGAAAGERLPNVPRFTATLNADYVLMPTPLKPTVGGSVSYEDARTASFDKNLTFPQYHLPDYTTVDLRSGVTLKSVDLQLYVHNVFDERGQLSLILPQFGARVAIEQPRTIGINATAHF